jgi:two-component system, NtrC family, response regulator HydG
VPGRARRLVNLEKPSFIEARSRAFGAVLELATRIAPFDSSLLITGESGVGKEVVARLVYARSQRNRGPFFAINCGALPETLLDSELFGHKAGSFTGATSDHGGAEAVDVPRFSHYNVRLLPTAAFSLLY